VVCSLEPMKKVVWVIEDYPWGILKAIVLKVGNGPAWGLNSRIKVLRIRSHGFRNKQRFANVICSHLSGLDLYTRREC